MENLTEILRQSAERAERRAAEYHRPCPNRARSGDNNGRSLLSNVHLATLIQLNREQARFLRNRPGFLVNWISWNQEAGKGCSTRTARRWLQRSLAPSSIDHRLLARLRNALVKTLREYGLLNGRIGVLFARLLHKRGKKFGGFGRKPVSETFIDRTLKRAEEQSCQL